MLKAIFAKHVKPGDKILVSGGDRLSVNDVELWGSRVRMTTHDADGFAGCCFFNEYDLVGLGHRPYPNGKTECDMKDDVDSAITSYRLGLVPVAQGRKAILEALAAYELGRPEAAEESKPKKRDIGGCSAGIR